ncbi:similar to An04g00190 [Aspergillus luchuensis]|uniref:Similar to An04g00190 n=1 Tax=Aspergillus kawachii TaxID=1069201 RepID=A0A146FI53_ASPKA|nr:similar to An04g00190 [Aspergillus luchuensis]
MATARLRRAFRYPDDSGDDEHSREELDEEASDDTSCLSMLRSACFWPWSTLRNPQRNPGWRSSRLPTWFQEVGDLRHPCFA